MEKNLIEKNFALYANKTESDYWIIVGGQRIPTNSTITTTDDENLIKRFESYVVFKDEFIERLSPNNISSCKFWKMATDEFPLFSIAGGIQPITNIDEVNVSTLRFANWLNGLNPVGQIFDKNPDSKILEIGPGHGGFHQAIKRTYGDKNYYAIDVNPLFKHPRLYKTNGRKIPRYIPNELDIVYSMNVFQHLSKAQRTAYYKQIWMVLKTGGEFVFGMFVVTKDNYDRPIWGCRDENGRFYCSFFRQLTPVDTEEELLSELKDIGFSVEALSTESDKTNYLTYRCIKNDDN